MTEELISVIDVARQLNKLKGTIFRIMKRLAIEPQKRRDSSSRNQFVAYITQDEFSRVSSEVLASANRSKSDQSDEEGNEDFFSAEQGVFYLVRLEPDHGPGRFK